jgi:protein-S-isoprenylcysteine O-methyltransferase Ste14
MRMMRPGLVIIALWIAFWLSWVVASSWSSRVDKRLEIKREVGYRLAMIVGGLMLAVPAHGYVGPLRIWMVSRNEAWACTIVIAIGFMFSWWARVHLGALWSGRITTKEEHRVIDTGPYAFVRHPIYTGILLAVYATAVAKGTVPGMVGAIVVTIGVWMKARLEEAWLGTELGAETYGAYRLRVPMLVPFGPRG